MKKKASSRPCGSLTGSIYRSVRSKTTHEGAFALRSSIKCERIGTLSPVNSYVAGRRLTENAVDGHFQQPPGLKIPCKTTHNEARIARHEVDVIDAAGLITQP